MTGTGAVNPLATPRSARSTTSTDEPTAVRPRSRQAAEYVCSTTRSANNRDGTWNAHRTASARPPRPGTATCTRSPERRDADPRRDGRITGRRRAVHRPRAAVAAGGSRGRAGRARPVRRRRARGRSGAPDPPRRPAPAHPRPHGRADAGGRTVGLRRVPRRARRRGAGRRGHRHGRPAHRVRAGADRPSGPTGCTASGSPPRPCRSGELTAGALADALRACLDGSSHRDRAAALGHRIRSEDGAAGVLPVLSALTA